MADYSRGDGGLGLFLDVDAFFFFFFNGVSGGRYLTIPYVRLRKYY